MGKPNFSDEFKRDAVARITERGNGMLSPVEFERQQILKAGGV